MSLSSRHHLAIRALLRSIPARLPSTVLLLLASLLVLIVPGRADAAERIKSATLPGDGTGTAPLMAGSLIRSANATTTWFLYPGACAERAAGTWAPRGTPQADSLNSYTAGSTGGYRVDDETVSETLWHVSDNATCTAGTTCPAALNGTRMIWCGKFDAGWVVKYGYPNFSYQILYVDTGAHAGATYNLTFNYQISAEFNYDFVYAIGGGGGLVDPYGNSRGTLDNIIAAGSYLIRWTGSIRPTSANATGGNTVGSAVEVADNPGSPATVTGASYTIDSANRAIYLVLQSDCFNSPEDGLWPEGHGQMLDNIATSDNGAIYTDQAAAGGVDAYNGNVLVGTAGAPVISARVAPGVGTLWQLVSGNILPTPDVCTPKNSGSDLIFEGGNAANFHTVAGQANSIVSCTFPIPVGTATVVALWDEYLDLPAYTGYVQFAEYRCFRDGSWANWRNTNGGGTRRVEAVQAWGTAGSDLGEAAQADSVQLRYSIRCVPELGADLHNCGDVIYGVLYDNLRLEVTTGIPAPTFGIYPAFLAQSTFVDGTIGGLGCSAGTAAAGQCWPGVRGSDIGTAAAVHDNFNSPLGDSIVASITSGLRGNGRGINWHRGFNKAVNFGLTITHTNPNFVAAFDAPRIIYRLFDPASKTWSPFDSSELDANGVSINAGDTVLIDSRYRMNWPPRDRIGQALPGGFSINGKTLYSQLAFLPRGTRVQYYWKGVDINGSTSFQFSSDALAREVEDLPTLPGSSIVAPDIIEFDVLPRAYPPGPVGTLLAGRTNTPILNLDGAYTAWSYSADPVTQALRALGVRADRYRMLQGTEQGGNVGGHEFAGTRPGRLANYFPNMDEYAIKDSLAAWYRIMIESTHKRSSFSVVEEADAKLIKQWWEASTGTDGGDRCLLSTGHDTFNALLGVSLVPHPNENALASQVFGVAGVSNQWNGGGSNPFPLIKDMFADPAAGPGLGTSGAYTYLIDGGCPGPDRFDALTKIGSPGAQNAATYPTFASVTNAAAVSYMSEGDTTGDHDRSKSLGYGYSIQAIRQGGVNFVDTRAQILYKFLTSCRGPRTAADTASCWPCPTDPNKYSNWLTSGGFQTGTYGPLYAIQDATRVLTAVDITPPPSFVDALLQNRPNPFNPETVIPYSLATPGRVSVRIYDVGGRLVRTVVDAIQPAGIHVARWNGVVESGKRSASGIYFYVITYPDGHKSSKKMTILR
jgi:hypothetical protein